MAYHVLDEAERCLGCKVPQCTKGCPIGTPIPTVISLLKENKLDEAGKRREHIFKAGKTRGQRRQARILLEHTYGVTLLYINLARIGGGNTGENLEKRGLARAVNADDAHAVAVVDGEGNVAQNDVRAEGKVDLIC